MKKITIAKLKERLHNQRLQSEIALNKMQLKLTEQVAYSPPYDLISPWAQFFDGQNLIFPIYPSRLDKRISSNYIFMTDAQLDLLRSYCRWLYETNPTARGVIESLSNYVIKTGFAYNIVPKRNRNVPKAELEKAQFIIDEFMEKNKWSLLEPEIFTRSKRDGEVFIQYFPQESGVTNIRLIEPEQVRAPQETPDWTFGIKTPEFDYVNHLAYFITYDATITNGEVIDKDYITFIKCNTDLNVKRGLSTFFATQESLINVQKLLRAGVLGESARQAISYIREFDSASEATIQSLQTANTDYYVPEPTYSATPRLVNAYKVEPGSQVDIPKSLKFQNPPTGSGANFDLVLKNAYQQLSAYWSVPSWMVSGDSGDGNYAQSLVSESPFIRSVEKQQNFYAHWYKEVCLRILHIAVDQDLFAADVLENITVQVEVPNCTVRNGKEETDKNNLLYDRGLLSARTWSSKEELDYTAEQTNIKEEPKLNVSVGNVKQDTGTATQAQTTEAEYKREIRKV